MNKDVAKMAVNRDMNFIRKQTIYKGCIHTDQCCNEIIDAHSIQENRFLDRISDNGEVLGIDFCKHILNYGIKLDRIGKGKASTFTGFCKYHDNSIFKPIEEYDYMPASAEQNYLYAYRAFAMNYYERYSSYNFKREHLKIVKSQGGDYKRFEKEINQYKMSIDVMENLRIAMNINLDKGRFNKVSTDLLIWPKNVETVATTVYFVHKDRDGNVINNMSGRWAPLFFTMFPQGNNTFILLSYLSKDKAKYGFIKKQIIDVPLVDQMMLVSNILALNVENLFIGPRYWNSISENMRNLFIKTADSKYASVPVGFYRNLNIFI